MYVCMAACCEMIVQAALYMTCVLHAAMAQLGSQACTAHRPGKAKRTDRAAQGAHARVHHAAAVHHRSMQR